MFALLPSNLIPTQYTVNFGLGLGATGDLMIAALLVHQFRVTGHQTAVTRWVLLVFICCSYNDASIARGK